jgi:hypothetical protein
MMSLGVFRPVARQFVAAAAMFGFSLNVATPTIAHGCAHVAAEAPMAGAAHQGHHPDPAPSDQSSHGKKCQCVGQSCGTAFAIPAPVATGPRPAPVVVAHSLPVPSADRLPAVAQHLLPFAVGPPGSIPA